jgi:hypothetical protein
MASYAEALPTLQFSCSSSLPFVFLASPHLCEKYLHVFFLASNLYPLTPAPLREIFYLKLSHSLCYKSDMKTITVPKYISVRVIVLS